MNSSKKNKDQDILKEIAALAESQNAADNVQLVQSKQKLKAAKASKQKTKLIFPEVFPKELNEIVNSFNDCFGFPKDYYGIGILTVAGAMLGNSYKVQYKRGWIDSPIIYGAIVGSPSIGKTHVINTVLAPVFELEDEFKAQYYVDYEAYRQEYFEFQNQKHKGEEPPAPQPKQLLINDATIEAINEVLENNPKGILYYKDELSAWVNTQNQYRSGADQEFWLSAWNNSTMKVNRKGKIPMYITNPFVSVFGAFTPSFLKKLAADDRSDNGFLARVLFAYPNTMEKPMPNDHVPNSEVYKLYKDIMMALYRLPNLVVKEDGITSYESIVIPLSDKARKRFKEFLIRSYLFKR